MGAPSIGLVCGHRSWVSKAIRYLTRTRFLFLVPVEVPVFCNHVFNVLADGAASIEALAEGLKFIPSWRERYDSADCWGVIVEVIGLSEDQRRLVDAVAFEHVGRRYDTLAIVKQAIDGILSQLTGHDIYLVRRFRLRFWERQERWHICGWLTSWTHAKAGWRFHRFETRVVKRQVGVMMRLYDEVVGTKPFTDDEFPRIAPSDIEQDVFYVRPDCHLIHSEFGSRPVDRKGRCLLPDTYIEKIAADRKRLLTPGTETP